MGMGRLFRVALGIIFFWTVAGLAQINIDALADESGALLESERNPLLICLTIGVGLGSVLAGIASGGRIELGLVPWGAAGMALFSVLLAFTPNYFLIGSPWHWKLVVACILLGGLGMSAGFFDVPLASYLQKKSPIEKRGSILSATNCLAFSGIMVASILFGQVLRSNTGEGNREMLPTEYQISLLEEGERQEIEKLRGELANKVSEFKSNDSGQSTELAGFKLPDSISENARKGLITELVWNDASGQVAAGEDIDREKYLAMFPDDQRQTKMDHSRCLETAMVFRQADLFHGRIIDVARPRLCGVPTTAENGTNCFLVVAQHPL